MNWKAVAGGALLCIHLSSIGQVAPGSLKWYARIAKQRGQPSITLKTAALPVARPPVEVLVKERLVVDGLVESVSRDSYDDFHIFTWYKVRLFLRGPAPRLQSAENDAAAPPEFSNISGNEILLRVLGGTALVDGVKITQNDGPEINTGKRYLFFLTHLNNNAFKLAPESLPIGLTDAGQFSPTMNSPYFDQLSHFETVQDLLNYSATH